MTAVSDADRAKAAEVTVHELKTWPSYFEAIIDGRKSYELRRDDRDFAVGDVLRLREWSVGSGYTGRAVNRVVTHVLRNVPSFGLADGYVILSLAEARAPYDRLTADLRALAEEWESNNRAGVDVAAQTALAAAARLRVVVAAAEEAKA